MKNEPFKHLTPGRQYTIVQTFVDYYGTTFPAGETYIFRGSTFLPYEDGLTLDFSQAGETRTIRLQWRAETQASIIENLEDYFVGTTPR